MTHGQKSLKKGGKAGEGVTKSHVTSANRTHHNARITITHKCTFSTSRSHSFKACFVPSILPEGCWSHPSQQVKTPKARGDVCTPDILVSLPTPCVICNTLPSLCCLHGLSIFPFADKVMLSDESIPNKCWSNAHA